MTNLTFNDFLCTVCKLPTSPGVCSHCVVSPRRRTVESQLTDKLTRIGQYVPLPLVVFSMGIAIAIAFLLFQIYGARK